jgi:hypothetical protein
MIGGGMQLSVGVKITGQLLPGGSVPSNTLPKPSNTVSGGAAQTLAYGTTLGLADTYCVGEYLILPGSNVVLDLYAGLPNVVSGDAAQVFLVKALVAVFVNSSGDPATGVVVGNAGSNEWVGKFGAAGQTERVYPNGAPFIASNPNGFSIDATHRNLKIANPSGALPAQMRVYLAGNLFLSGSPTGMFPLPPYA